MTVGEVFQLIALICGVVVGLMVLIFFGVCIAIDYMDRKKLISNIKGRGKNIKIICDGVEPTSARLK